MRDDELETDIDALPLRTRWRYRLRPAWLRVLINRACPGRWTQLEVDQIRRRAHEDWLALRSCIDWEDGQTGA